ncbi:acyl-CoA/acyl-ACP dehydrogenase [Microbacterium horticulturae]|uniref:Acyl-CoA/acyl-ACP dehydrogenase n=2 Tax=Microbacterium horticulturae TaxID=3028316 RepID=A0ABY8BYA3_9MICO|nr:acyl-CoA dehydrogenase family protein [Microbacterium sp. KACC 23027]WEG09175.1 acyl-CoA/acyl-ACP dehydrogenase [Microbacterium sp. KACC 23027]
MADVVRTLSQYCTSSALVLAMHTIEVFTLERFGETSLLSGLLDRVVSDQILLANATSEFPTPDGGAALIEDAGALRVDRSTIACSYGLDADVILTHVRRAPDAARDDRIYVVIPTARAEIEQTSTWDTLGLRGTCSNGLRIRSEIDVDAVFPTPWPTIMNSGFIQVRHILAGAAYVGIAEAALREAHAVVRREARRSVGTTPPSAARLAELLLEVEKLRGLLAGVASRFDELDRESRLDDIAYISSLRNLKVASTAVATEVATKSLQICGIQGIQRGGSMVIERIVRDAHAALVMFGNDGLLRQNAEVLIARKSI